MQESEYIYRLSNQHKTHTSPQALHRAPCPSGRRHQQPGGDLSPWGGTANALALRPGGKTLCPVGAEMQWAVVNRYIKACWHERFLCEI